MKIVIDKNIPFLDGVFDPFFDTRYLSYEEITRKNIQDTDILLIRTRTKCGRALLEGSSVKLIVTATVGVDHLDISYLNKQGISWENVAGCNATAVVQYVFTAVAYFMQKTQGSFKEKTIGIIGVGNVGEKIKQCAKKIGMKVLCCDPPRQKQENLPNFVPLSDIAQSADIITLHTDYTLSGEYATHNLINQDFLNCCKPGVWLINTARGEVIDQSALKRALTGGIVSQAAIDVWKGEPKFIDAELPYAVTIATPHIAGYSLQGKTNASRQIVDKIAAYSQQPLTFVSPSTPTYQIQKDNTGISDQQTLLEIITQTYNIINDTKQFLCNPLDAEKIRSNYNYRPGFESFAVSLTKPTPKLIEQLLTLGFQC